MIQRNATVLVFAGRSFNTFQLPERKPWNDFCVDEVFLSMAADRDEGEVCEGAGCEDEDEVLWANKSASYAKS